MTSLNNYTNRISISDSIEILQLFGNITELKPNLGKTKAVLLGSVMEAKEDQIIGTKLEDVNRWEPLQLFFSYDKQENVKKNVTKKYMNTKLDMWRGRRLFLFRKCPIVKSLRIIANHIFSFEVRHQSNLEADQSQPTSSRYGNYYAARWLHGQVYVAKDNSILVDVLPLMLELPLLELLRRELGATWSCCYLNSEQQKNFWYLTLVRHWTAAAWTRCNNGAAAIWTQGNRRVAVSWTWWDLVGQKNRRCLNSAPRWSCCYSSLMELGSCCNNGAAAIWTESDNVAAATRIQCNINKRQF